MWHSRIDRASFAGIIRIDCRGQAVAAPPPGMRFTATSYVRMLKSAPALRHLRKAVKARWFALRARFVQRFLAYDRAELLDGLRRLGVRDGDTLMLHSGFAPHHGFRGTIESLTDTFIDAVGPRGHLMMVSLPYRSSSIEYLQQGRQFDVRRTPSMMGLVSEYFRRRPEVLRSLHPTHPILARGPEAQQLIAGHENCLFPCGPGTPFDRLAERDGIVAFFNVPFVNFTFFHFLEHHVSGELPFRLYTDEPWVVPVIDRNGETVNVKTYVFAPTAIRRRRFEVLEQALRDRGLIAQWRIGNTRMEAVRVREVIRCVDEMRRAGQYFYDLAPAASHPDEGPPPR